MDFIFKTIEGVINLPSVNLLLGKRGSGKSALCYYLLDKLSKRYNIQAGVLGFPVSKSYLLPQRIKSFSSFDFPENCAIFIDEGSFFAHARRSSQQANVVLDQLMATARHRNWILLIATHHSTKIDISVVRDSDAILFKEPSRLSVEYGSRKGFLQNLILKVKSEFDKILTDKRGYTYVFSEEYEGMLYNMLPSFWTEELSKTTVRPITVSVSLFKNYKES